MIIKLTDKQYAASRGLQIKFSADDIRAFSISAYIELCKRNAA